jgi:ferric-dicitrate binding protein FerR (iron transport regulator)
MIPHDEILEKLGRYTDGVASADEIRALNDALREDRALRREYLRYMNIDAALPQALSAEVRADPHQPASRRRWLHVCTAAAAVLLVATGWLFWPRHSEEVAISLATLVAGNDPIWNDVNVELALQSGQLPEGNLQLESGTAEFLLLDGATVVLRGPATFRFSDRKYIFVEEGQVLCRCPTPESRITVATPVTEIIDLGTEFAVEARADRNTRVAVRSGEVQVGTRNARHLAKGEVAEIRSDGLLVIRPLERDEFRDLIRSAPPVADITKRGENRLKDPGFEGGLGSQTWNGTATNIAAVPQGRNGKGVRISAHGNAQWPQCRQKVATGDIGGQYVVASAWVSTPADDRLRPGQCAMVKIAFVNERGREFAFVKRHVLHAQSPAGCFEEVHLAAVAPSGTRSVQLQVILNAHTHRAGSVICDDASLVIVDTPPVP